MGKAGSGGGGVGGGTFTRQAATHNLKKGDKIVVPDSDIRSVKAKKAARDTRLNKRGTLDNKQIFDYDKNVAEVVNVDHAKGTVKLRARRGNEGIIPTLDSGRSKPRRSGTVKYFTVPVSNLKGATLRRARENLEYKLT